MAKQKRLVLEHLEDISWKVLDEYSPLIREMIRGQAGVYALYRKQKLYYVGLATNLMSRLKSHLRDRHHGSWDRFSVYLTVRSEHMKELESLLLRIVNPVGNKTAGKFVSSMNLRSTLNRRLKEFDADRRARLMGGPVARRRRQIKTRRDKGSIGLAGVADQRIPLKASYRGREYRAGLRRDGRIGFRKKVYDSPTAAARAAIRKTCNGWSFWRFRNRRGEWVKLKELRTRGE